MSQTTAGAEFDEKTIEHSADTPEASPRDSDATSGPFGAVRRILSRVPGELYILTILASITRFVALSSPRSIVFDEVYFREYALHYKAGTYYFDLHPPLGKLLLGAWGAIAGVDATALNKDPAVAMRILPAACGVALILVVYLLIRQLSGSRRVATLGAGLLMLDNALLVESRFILIDSMLLLFGISAVTLSLAARKRTGRSYWLLLAASATLAGMAVATKLTGVSALGLIGLLWLADVIHEKRWRTWKPLLGQLAILAIAPMVVYMASFAIHFALLPKTGPGDAFMGAPFQATIKGNPQYNPNAHRSFFHKFGDLNKSMHQYELGLDTVVHPYSSKWPTWPIMKRGVYLFVSQASDGKTRYIYELGNPVVWWGTILGVIISIAGWFARPERYRPYKWALLFLAAGWLANWLPFALITRPMFVYHYFYALIFSLSFAVIGVGALTGWINDGPKPFTFPSRLSAIGYWSVLGTALLVFLYFAPISYGIPLTTEGLESRMWLHTWR